MPCASSCTLLLSVLLFLPPPGVWVASATALILQQPAQSMIDFQTTVPKVSRRTARSLGVDDYDDDDDEAAVSMIHPLVTLEEGYDMNEVPLGDQGRPLVVNFSINLANILAIDEPNQVDLVPAQLLLLIKWPQN